LARSLSYFRRRCGVADDPVDHHNDNQTSRKPSYCIILPASLLIKDVFIHYYHQPIAAEVCESLSFDAAAQWTQWMEVPTQKDPPIEFPPLRLLFFFQLIKKDGAPLLLLYHYYTYCRSLRSWCSNDLLVVVVAQGQSARTSSGGVGGFGWSTTILDTLWSLQIIIHLFHY